MRKLFCFITLTVLLSSPLFAQEISMTGTVYSNEDNRVLSNVNIIIRSKVSNKIVAFGVSKESGEFQINIKTNKSLNATISFSYIGFETITHELSGNDQSFKIIMHPTTINIKEVRVKAPKIRAQGDTIIYNVASYAREYDKTIGDVLKKLPGIEVKENGQINFNGVPINKFYIEGSDLLGGKYGIATNSISSKNVSTVQVMQNHQPVRALEGLSFSDQAAINIKLKEDAKQRWAGTLQGGTGFTPFLWDARLTAMRFTKKLQTINTYKTNNTGIDVTREFTSFDPKELINRYYRLPVYINTNPPFSLGLDRKRELFNRTHQVSTNNLTNLKNGLELKINCTYMDHRETAENKTETVYYESQSDTILISENEDSRYSKKNLTVGLVLEANKPTYNLTNKLNGDFSWIDRNITLTGSYPNRQSASSPHRQLSNDLYILKRFKKDFVTFESYMLYQKHPQELMVSRSSSTQAQNIHQSGFYTNNKAGYGFVLGRIVTSLIAGISIMQKTLDTQLDGIEINNMNDAGDTKLGYIHSYAIPKVEFDYHGIKTTFSVPLNYYTYKYKNKISNETQNYDTFLFTPNLSIRMELTPQFKFSLSGGIGKSGVNDKLFYPAMILNNYRSISKGLPAFVHNTRRSLSAEVSCKQPLNELFSGLSLTRSWNKTPYILNQTFTNEYILSSYSLATNKSNTWLLTGFFNKGIDFFKGYFFFNATYYKNDALLIRNNAQIPNTRTNLLINPKIETNFTKWLVLNYALNYSHNTMSSGNDSEKASTDNISQSILARFLTAPKWNICLQAEHYYNEISDTQKKHFILTDITLSYRIGKIIELTLNINNIFNQKNYSYSSFNDDISTIYRSYHIRPRNILLSTYFVF